jgi:1,4-dihydroxy-2-naphthoate octaprenyltransferase
VKVWFKEAVEPSLLMSFLLVTLGTVVAARNGYFNPSYYILAVIGVTLAQNSVNVLNDYYDYKTGVDARTTKTPFSGGSRFIVSGLIRPQGAFFFGIASLLLATPIAIFFVATRGLPMILIVLHDRIRQNLSRGIPRWVQLGSACNNRGISRSNRKRER